LAQASATAPARFAEARLLTPAVGYLRIPSFASRSPDFSMAKTDADRDKALEPVRRQMDREFEQVAATRALVLDLRGNAGGADLLGAYLVSHLLSDDFVYYTTQTRCSPDLKKLPGFAYLPGEEGWAERSTWKPRQTVFSFFKGKTYPGSVIALVDEGCASTTDCVLACLTDLHAAFRTIGRPTHGAAGGPTILTKLKHSKADLQLSIMRVWSPKGRLIEGQGTAPNFPVEWTSADILHGRDPDLDTALKEIQR
jgi:C-terminal processing protease CtpA/Prc